MLFGLDKWVMKLVLKRILKGVSKMVSVPTQGQVRTWGTVIAIIVACLNVILKALGLESVPVQVPGIVERIAEGIAVLLQLLPKDKPKAVK